jgi:two-component system chemotaxis response regulator CheY
MPKTILIVDDEVDLREIMFDLLTDEGFHCLLAESKTVAAKKLLEDKDGSQVELVVTDYNMPGGSGLDLLIHVREKGVKTPFLFLSGEPIDEKLAPYINDGVLGYKLKPFDLMDFVDRVNEFFAGGHELSPKSSKN